MGLTTLAHMGIAKLVRQNIGRNLSRLAIAAIGLIVGIASFVFFFSLGAGVKRVVLEEIFVIRQIEVVPKLYDVAMTRFALRKLDENVIDKLAEIPNVVAVYPKMKFTFPAWASGGKEVLGKNFRAEVIADGIPPSLVQDEMAHAERFRDWDAEFACDKDGSACPPGQFCAAGICQKLRCRPEAGASACPTPTYCVKDTATCDMPIPIIVNPSLLNIYNSGLTTALASGTGMRLPKLTPEALIGFIFDVELGISYLGDSAQGEPKERKFQCVGLSDRAISVGFTLPINYARRFNAYFSGERQSRDYHSIVVEAAANEDVAAISLQVKAMGFELDEKHAKADRISLMIAIITLLFSLISILIVTISAINIGQSFFLIVAQRSKEIGILRALGASRKHIAAMILAEGTAVGVIGASLGVLLSLATMAAVDFVLARFIPDFPFKPESLFVVEPWVITVGILGGIAFCLIGAFFPARKAASTDPAQAFN